MQQAIPNNRVRQSKQRIQTVRHHLELVGNLAGEMLALASLIAALTAGFLLLTLALPPAT
jgi:hypothetical protein